MIRLVVQNQVTNKLQELDTFGNENIALTLQVDDVRDIESKNASYSKDFNLPATKTNNKFFEHYYNLDVYAQNYNAYKNVKAYLYDDEVLILEGFLRLLNVVEKSTEITYNVVLFNDVANIIETLGDATIRDLDFSDIEHNITEANVYNSWDNTGVTLSDATQSTVPFYPLVNNGGLMADLQGQININPYESYILNIKLKYLVDKIFGYAGFNYNSNFFTGSLFNEIYFDTTINTDIGDNNITDVIEASDINNATPQLALGWSQVFDNVTLSFDTETGDDDGYFNETTSIFTAPFDCILQVYAYVNIKNDFNFGGQVDLTVNTTSNGVPIYYNLDTAFASPNATASISLSGQVIVPSGATAKISLIAPSNVLGDDIYVVASNLDKLILTVLPYNLTDEAITSRLGDIKLSDVLKDLTKIFNLTFESTGNNTLKIEPYDTFTSNAPTLDWTSKINTNEFVIEPIEIPKRIEFKHALEDEDYYKGNYNKRNVIEYGSQIVEFDVDNDEIKSIETEVFSAPYITKVLGANIYTQNICEYDDGTLSAYDNKPRLVFKRNTIYTGVDLNDPNGFFDTIQMSEWQTDYANATMYDDDLSATTSSTNSLLFGLIETSHLNGILNTQPTNTLYNQYWFNYINEKYNTTNGLILKAEFNLKKTDILNFSFANKIRIKDQLYRVNKIEYNTDKNSLAKVELLRI